MEELLKVIDLITARLNNQAEMTKTLYTLYEHLEKQVSELRSDVDKLIENAGVSK